MIRFAKIRDVKTPTRGSALSAGIDFYVPNDFGSKKIFPGEDILIPSGIIVEIPEHTAFIGIDKSGIASSKEAKERCGLAEKNLSMASSIIVGAKLIDADYHGEVHIHLINVGKVPIFISAGMKVAQFVLVPVFFDSMQEVMREDLHILSTERMGGFGSTGK